MDASNLQLEDWFFQPLTMKLNQAKGFATVSILVGHAEKRLCGRYHITGRVSGNQVPDDVSYHLPPAQALSRFSLRNLHGTSGTVRHGEVTKDVPEFQAVARRKSGGLALLGGIPNEDSLSYELSGIWILKEALNISKFFNIN